MNEQEKRCYALVTVFHFDESNVENIRKISEQVNAVFVCDNSSQNSSDIFKTISNCCYINMGGNKGLSQAFNLVLKDNNRLWNDDDFIIFFDQDSTIENNHVEMLIQEFLNLKKCGKRVGCIGPQYYNKSSKKIEVPKIRKKISEKTYQVQSIIASSMLCQYRTLAKIGFWNDLIFLDMADWDICWRFIENGYYCYMTSVVTLEHSVGNGEIQVGSIHFRKNAPVRVYYQIRNILYLLHTKYAPFRFRVRYSMFLLTRPIIYLLFFDNKKKRLKYYFGGIVDYYRKIYGEIKM